MTRSWLFPHYLEDLARLERWPSEKRVEKRAMAATFLVMNATSMKRVLWLERQSRVVISAPRLLQMDRRRMQEEMNRLLGVSGYGLGLTAVVAALVLSILWVGAHWAFFVANCSPTLGLGVTACLFAGGLGRTTGFLYARWRLARLVWSTVAEMDDRGGGAGGDARGIGSQRTRLLSRNTFAQ